MPSHDHLHHYRVWHYIKTLLPYLSIRKNFTREDIENLIIATLFHDTGLTIDPGPNHGNISSKLCANYLENESINEKQLQIILEAIEKHDDKFYLNHSPDPNKIANILTICDDLDAFGYLGIYRYIEIYQMRSVPFKKMIHAIIDNLQNRFHFFYKMYGFIPEFAEFHKRRYQSTHQFFMVLSKDITLTSGEYEFYKRLKELINSNSKMLTASILKTLQINHNNLLVKQLMHELEDWKIFYPDYLNSD